MSAPDVAVPAPTPTLRAEAEALLAASIYGIAGGAVGLVIGLIGAATALWGDWSFAAWTARAAATAAGVSSALGYWRSRTTDGQEWRTRSGGTCTSVSWGLSET